MDEFAIKARNVSSRTSMEESDWTEVLEVSKGTLLILCRR